MGRDRSARRGSGRSSGRGAGGLAALAVAAAGGLVLARGLGARRWRRESDRDRELLDARSREPDPLPVVSRDDEVPSPVRRYLAFALPDAEREPPTQVCLSQKGSFRPPTGGWKPFTAVQHMTASPPGFVWDARIRMVPWVDAWIRDGYVDGRGAMRGSLSAVVPLVDAQPSPELDAASLQRFLAEAVWLPGALRPSASLRWTELEPRTDRVIGEALERARATLTDGAVEASLDVCFDRRGAIVEMRGERFREVDGRFVATPWICRYFDWVTVAGTRIPRRGEAAWVLPDVGEQAYWRGRITEAELGEPV